MAKSLVAELHLLIHKMLKGLGRKSLSCGLAIYCNYLKKKEKKKEAKSFKVPRIEILTILGVICNEVVFNSKDIHVCEICIWIFAL